MIKKILTSKLGTFLFVVAAYGLIDLINSALTSFLNSVPGVDWVHLPSGCQFLLVLIAGWVGALGVGIASLIAAIWFTFPNQFALGFEMAFINGLAPLLARVLFVKNFGVKDDLSDITMRQIVLMGIVFACLNSSLNQLVLYWNQEAIDFVDGVLAMLIGDMTGTLLIILLLRQMARSLIDSDGKKSLPLNGLPIAHQARDTFTWNQLNVCFTAADTHRCDGHALLRRFNVFQAGVVTL